MTFINLINLQSLMDQTSGSAGIRMGLFDNPGTINHPELTTVNIYAIPG